MVEYLEGLSLCFAPSAAVAGLLRLARSAMIPPRRTVVMRPAGSGR